MLSFLPVALIGWVIIYLTASRMLRGELDADVSATAWRVEIPVASRALLENRQAEQVGLAETQEYRLLEIRRWGEILGAETPIEAGDVLVFAASEGGIAALWRSPLFGLPPHRLYAVTIRAGETGTLHDVEQDGSIRLVAARSAEPLHETELVPGATCYVAGETADAVARTDAVALWQVAGSRVPQPAKTSIALLVLLGVIVAASFGLAPAELASAGGAVLMVLTGVITPRSAARALDMRLLFILAGSIGLGTIVVESGLADAISDTIRDLSGGNAAVVILVFASATAVITNLVTNAATASILTPVGVAVAREVGIDPVTLLALIGTCVCSPSSTP